MRKKIKSRRVAIADGEGWNPPASSVGLAKIFSSLDEKRQTEWTVNKKGELEATLRAEPSVIEDIDFDELFRKVGGGG